MKKPTQKHNWYVYKYVDPRPEKEGTVVYIGKGTHNGDGQYLKRMRTHWQATAHKNHLFRRVLDKISGLGLTPEISVVSWHDSERGALDAEIENIAKYGLRRDGGTLCNLTLGGEGTEGFIHTAEEKAKVSEASKAHWENPDYRARRGASLRKYLDDHPEEIVARANKTKSAWTDEKKRAHAELVIARGPEHGRKIRDSLLANPEFLRKASENASTVLQDPEMIARRKVTLKQTMSDPEFRRQLAERTKEALAKPEAKANQRAASKKMWESAEHRAKMAEIRSVPVSEETRKKIGAASKAAIANQDPETKARLAAMRSKMATERHAHNRAAKLAAQLPVDPAAIAKAKHDRRSAASKKRWESAEYREKFIANQKAAMATPEAKAKKSEVTSERWADPDFKARNSAAIKAAITTPEHRAKVSAINKALWLDPAKRAAQSEKMKALLADPEAKARKSAAMKLMWEKRKAAKST